MLRSEHFLSRSIQFICNPQKNYFSQLSSTTFKYKTYIKMVVDTMQPVAYAIIGTFLGISTFFLALRVWSRIIMWKEANRDAMMLWSKYHVDLVSTSLV